MDSINPDDMDGGAERSREVLTGDIRAQFDRVADVTKSAAQQSKTSTDTRVDPTGVPLLDGDNTEVQVFPTVSATSDGVVQGSQSDPQLVWMAKVDGRWLLSNIAAQ